MDLNIVTVIGNIASEIKFSETATTAVTHFRIAVEDFNGNDMYFDTVSFGNTAKYISDYLEQGDRIAITGALTIQNNKDSDGKYTLPATAVKIHQIEKIYKRV